MDTNTFLCTYPLCASPHISVQSCKRARLRGRTHFHICWACVLLPLESGGSIQSERPLYRLLHGSLLKSTAPQLHVNAIIILVFLLLILL